MPQVLTPEPFRRVDAPGESPFERRVLDALAELDEGQERLFRGQSELTVAYGGLAQRTAKLEQDASWKARAIVVGKALAPFLLGLAAPYVPGLAAQLPELLTAIAGLQ